MFDFLSSISILFSLAYLCLSAEYANITFGLGLRLFLTHKFFPNLDLDIDEYGNAGVIFFHSKFLKVFENVFNFYLDNKQELDNWNKGGGREQTIFNFTLKKMGIKPKILSPKWNLISMHKRGLFMNNFQFQDNTPHFIKYGYIWHFTGFAIEDRIKVVNDTWNLIKQNYDI